MRSYHGKHVFVLGLARSGVAAAQLLVQLGAHVTVADRKTDLPDVRTQLEGLPVDWVLGPGADILPEGVDTLLISPGVPIDAPIVRQARSRGIPVIGELELAYQNCPTAHLAAITGTNGKTTTTALLLEMFLAAGREAWAAGNIGTPLAALVGDMTVDSMVALEVSSFQLESIDTFRPQVSAILNLTEDHLNRHGDMAGYAAAKARVFINQTLADVLVINGDDARVCEMAQSAHCQVVAFSRKREVEEGACVQDGQVVFVRAGQRCPICAVQDIQIKGAHNLENALAATAVAIKMGIPPAAVARALRTFKGVEHRMEPVCEAAGVRFINDSKGTNPDSTLRALEAIDRPTVLIAGGYDKHTPFEGLAHAVASSPVKAVVLIGQTAPQLEQALRGAGVETLYREADMRSAVYRAAEVAGPGAQVLLSPACASFDMFSDYEQRGAIFKAIVQQWKEEQDAC
nr:UDP-N-acetylmuramoyl-L-alanine--D-glutamate ligase [bacterium]